MYKEEMISFLKSNPDVFNEVLTEALSFEDKLAWRAAWLISLTMDYNDSRVKKIEKKIIDILLKSPYNLQRELLKILHNIEVSEKIEGKLFDVAINIWIQINNASSARYNAFKIIVKTMKKHPDLYEELSYLIEKHYLEVFTLPMQSSIFRRINDLNKFLGKDNYEPE